MKYMKRGLIVKEERFDELTQYGYILFMSLFILFALAGWFMDNELLIWMSVIFLLYIPFIVCAITIRSIGKTRKREKRKREKARRLRESKLLRCRSCDRIYKREELDISTTTVPRCPDCGKKLTPED